MLISYLENTAKNLASEVFPPWPRYFTYFFIIVGIMWLGGANYYYYADEYTRFKATMITGLGFFFLSGVTMLWEYYIKTEKAASNAVTVANTNSDDLIAKILPVALPMVLNILKKIPLRVPSFKTIVVTGFVGAFLYYSIRKL